MLVLLFRLLSKLPLFVLHGIGALLGWIVYLTSPSYRRRMNENLSRAGFLQHRRAAIRESGKGALELAFIWCAPQERVLKKAHVDDWAFVQKLLEEKRSVIFLTPHLGCFEITAQFIASYFPLTVLYRPPRKAALKPLIEDARARANLSLAPANLAGVRLLLKALKRGEPIGLLPDQVPQQGEGVWANFFGKPAYTMTLPAKLQQLSDAQILLAYSERMPFGRGYRLRFSAFDEVLAGTPAQQAQAINRSMEQLIAACPAQYLWSYNRYKTPAGVAPFDSQLGAND